MDWNPQEKLALKGRFIDNSIKKYIDSMVLQRVERDISPILHFTTYLMRDSDNNKIIELSNNIISQTVEFQNLYRTNDEKLKIYWFPTPIIKRLPKNNKESLDVPEINSACTFHYTNNRFIALYRMEEAPKVLYHELIHFYYLDTPLEETHDNYFKTKYNLKIPCSLRETYSEFLGCLLNIERVSKMTGVPFLELYNIEYAFMNYQAQKILDFFKINSKNQLYRLQSDTNLITYYLFKLALFMNLDNPRQTLLELERQKLNMRKPELFVAAIEKGLDNIFNQSKISVIPELRETMRMTIIEL